MFARGMEALWDEAVSASDGGHAVSCSGCCHVVTSTKTHERERVTPLHGPECDGDRDLPKGSSSTKSSLLSISVGLMQHALWLQTGIVSVRRFSLVELPAGLDPLAGEISTTLRETCDCNHCTCRRSPSQFHSVKTAEIAVNKPIDRYR